MSTGTIIVAAAIIAAVALAVYILIRDRRKGKCSCGGNCGCCSSHCGEKPSEPR